MKKIFLILLLLLLLTITFSLEISGSYLMELGGYQRTFYGASVKLGDRDFFGIEIGGFVPPDTIEIEEIYYVQPTVFLLVQLPIGFLKPFAGISPIFQYYEESFSVYSYTMYLTKAGLSIYLGPIAITGGVNTVFDLSFQQTFGIFGAYAELGLSF